MMTETQSHETYIIKTWPCCYYDNSSRRWIYGTLCVMGKGLRFTTDKEDTVDILYSDIAQAKKSMTGLIFRAVVVDTINGEKHWFSSFNDAYSVVQYIRFFLKSKLLQKKGSIEATKTEGRTEMGRKLLSVAVDSEKTLRNAAEVLTTQVRKCNFYKIKCWNCHIELTWVEFYQEEI